MNCFVVVFIKKYLKIEHTIHFHVLYFCIMYFGSVWVSGLVLPYTKLVKPEDVHLGG